MQLTSSSTLFSFNLQLLWFLSFYFSLEATLHSLKRPRGWFAQTGPCIAPQQRRKTVSLCSIVLQSISNYFIHSGRSMHSRQSTESNWSAEAYWELLKEACPCHHIICKNRSKLIPFFFAHLALLVFLNVDKKYFILENTYLLFVLLKSRYKLCPCSLFLLSLGFASAIFSPSHCESRT